MFTTDYKGGAQPPPVHNSCSRALASLVLALLLALFPFQALAQNQQSAQPSTQADKKKPLKKTKAAPQTSAWAFSQGPRPPNPADQIWKRGLAAKALKEAAVVGLKNKALKNQVKAPTVPPVAPPKPRATNIESAPLPPTAQGMPLGKGLHVRSDSLNSSWHNSAVKNDMRIDQDIIRQESNVYGAYTDIEAAEDVIFSAGPEFTHTRSQNSPQHNPSDSSTLGLGLQLKWGF